MECARPCGDTRNLVKLVNTRGRTRWLVAARFQLSPRTDEWVRVPSDPSSSPCPQSPGPRTVPLESWYGRAGAVLVPFGPFHRQGVPCAWVGAVLLRGGSTTHHRVPVLPPSRAAHPFLVVCTSPLAVRTNLRRVSPRSSAHPRARFGDGRDSVNHTASTTGEQP